jgi:hypothetical protein
MLTFSALHVVTSQTIEAFITAAVRTSTLTKQKIFFDGSTTEESYPLQE